MQIGCIRHWFRLTYIQSQRTSESACASTVTYFAFVFLNRLYMSQTSTELAESLHQFTTIWKLIGRPFPNVDQVDKLGLAISWPDTEFPFYNALF
jgi:hypothetical protein